MEERFITPCPFSSGPRCSSSAPRPREKSSKRVGGARLQSLPDRAWQQGFFFYIFIYILGVGGAVAHSLLVRATCHSRDIYVRVGAHTCRRCSDFGASGAPGTPPGGVVIGSASTALRPSRSSLVTTMVTTTTRQKNSGPAHLTNAWRRTKLGEGRGALGRRSRQQDRALVNVV